jgi:hypothetical protein
MVTHNKKNRLHFVLYLKLFSFYLKKHFKSINFAVAFGVLLSLFLYSNLFAVGVQTSFPVYPQFSPFESVPVYSQKKVNIPEDINIVITGHIECQDWYRAGRPIIGIKKVNFKEYVETVVYREWGTDKHFESLKAGSVAIKMFAMYKLAVKNTLAVRYGGDIMDNTCDQWYKPVLVTSKVKQAVNEVWDKVFLRGGGLLNFHYVNNDQNCANWFPGKPCMGQWNSHYLAQRGYNWKSILHHYYDPIEIISFGKSLCPNPLSGIYSQGKSLDCLGEGSLLVTKIKSYPGSSVSFRANEIEIINESEFLFGSEVLIDSF